MRPNKCVSTILYIKDLDEYNDMIKYVGITSIQIVNSSGAFWGFRHYSRQMSLKKFRKLCVANQPWTIDGQMKDIPFGLDFAESPNKTNVGSRAPLSTRKLGNFFHSKRRKFHDFPFANLREARTDRLAATHSIDRSRILSTPPVVVLFRVETDDKHVEGVKFIKHLSGELLQMTQTSSVSESKARRRKQRGSFTGLHETQNSGFAHSSTHQSSGRSTVSMIAGWLASITAWDFSGFFPRYFQSIRQLDATRGASVTSSPTVRIMEIIHTKSCSSV